MGAAECAHASDIFCLLYLASTHTLQHPGCYLATAASLCAGGSWISGYMVSKVAVAKYVWPAVMLLNVQILPHAVFCFCRRNRNTCSSHSSNPWGSTESCKNQHCLTSRFSGVGLKYCQHQTLRRQRGQVHFVNISHAEVAAEWYQGALSGKFGIIPSGSSLATLLVGLLCRTCPGMGVG